MSADELLDPPHRDPTDLAAESLARDIAAHLGLVAVQMRPVVGGAGNLAFEVHGPEGELAAFVRVERPTGGFGTDRYGLTHEAAVLPVAAQLGFPVPAVLGTLSEPPGIVMSVVPGT
ncbi:MAG: hypothetical protein ACYDD7_03890, partial [Acidimicrobiales bacterium]